MRFDLATVISYNLFDVLGMKRLNTTLLILISVTVLAAVTSELEIKYTTFVILGLAVFKFIGVSFFFMDLRKAHLFWKSAILIFLLIFTTSILLIG